MNCSVAGLCPSDVVIVNRAANRDVERDKTNALFAGLGLKSLAGLCLKHRHTWPRLL